MNDRFRVRIWFEIGKKYAYFGKPIINIKGLGRAEGTGLLFEILPGQTMYLGNNNIEQCTGLKDANGRLVYEGDIIASRFQGQLFTANIKYFRAGWVAEFHNWKPSLYLMCREAKFEVIGNIHENPELLEDL